MGAEYFGYASVACSTFPVNGKFDCQQKAIYDGVLQIRNKLLESIKPGLKKITVLLKIFAQDFMVLFQNVVFFLTLL